MICVNCGLDDDKVIDTRPMPVQNWIFRRRRCKQCRFKWTTYEISILPKHYTGHHVKRSKTVVRARREAKPRPKRARPASVVSRIDK